jgi:hypothetical protein
MDPRTQIAATVGSSLGLAGLAGAAYALSFGPTIIWDFGF